MKRFMTIALAASCGFFFACASAPKGADSASAATGAEANGDWDLVSFEKDGEKISVATATLSITDNGDGSYAVSGFSGVNNYSGSLTVSGNNITFAPNLASTRMAGPQDAMEFEAAYLELLGNADTLSVTDSELSLSGGKTVARFAKKALEGSAWKLTGANTGNAVVSQSGNITLAFNGGKATVFTGINTGNFDYALDEKARALSFADGPLTMRAGTEEEMKAQQLFLENIFKTVSYSLTGDRLTFYNADGTTLLNFVKQ